MPNPVDDVNDVFSASVSELQEIVGSTDASSEQRRIAKDSLRDVWLLHGAHAIQEVHGRTALLAGLLSELQEVIDSIERQPFGDELKRVETLVTTTRALYKQEKESLRTPNG